ncbi:thymopoietin a isoform X7 [Ctenopharyngodon idella]|uniref:thymopoietin a isoform X7 n=1 Tax=Ctenopharyngodon idella TaxID=7959 RepID=UPI00222EEC43|nr:thymopoietin a isoform X7 [Ctenopharyngodon idella]
MSEFLEDPSVLTKDKLKSVLLAHNVALPNGDQRKDVYVQLYLKNLTAQNKKSSGSPDVFSSDEELPPAPVVSNRSRSGRKATRKTDKVRPEDVDVTELSNEGLKDLLLKYGLNAGPIVASTRKVYEKRLQKLLDQGPPEAVAPPSETSQTDGSQNGNTDSDQYSDKEEETVAPAPVFVPEPEPEVEPEPIPVVERPVRSRGKTPVTSRTRSGQHNKEDEEDKQEEDWPVLNVKRKLKRSSHRLDQMVPASDDTENSELSSAEYFPVSQDRRRTGYVESCGSPETQPKTRQSKITPFLSQITSARGLDSSQMETPKKETVEKVSAIDQTPRTVERDVLKEIFPNENLSTPTGISATCRRPIKGAAGRPLGETWLDESRLRHTEFRETSSSSYKETRSVPRVAAVPLAASKPVAPPAVKTRARRSLPVWVQLLLLSAVAGFLFFVYQAMETNEVGLFKQSGADDSTSK